jgi:single-strand DNA-binding protein
MSRSVNKVILVGNAGHDPSLKTTADGTKVAHLSLATSRRVARGDRFDQRTEWHRLTLWDRLALLAQDYIRKGDRLFIEGSMEYGSFERNGVTIPTAEIRVRELIMLGSSNRGSPVPPAEPSTSDASGGVGERDVTGEPAEPGDSNRPGATHDGGKADRVGEPGVAAGQAT